MTSLPIFRDPLFQLNLMLWATISRPEVQSIASALCQSGYILRALSQKLAPGVEHRIYFHEKLDKVGAPSPDVLIESISGHPWLVVECKATSFSETSSNCVQAKKLLILAADLSNVLGLADRPAAALLTYMVPADAAAAQLATLNILSEALLKDGMASALFGVFGIYGDETAIGIELLTAEETFALLPPALSSKIPVLSYSEGQDPRPLYLLPFDPSITQEADEANKAKSQLLQRAYTEIISAIARAQIPQRVTIDARDVLRRITFGVSQNWRGPDADLTASIIAESGLRDIKLLNASVDARVESRTIISLTIPSVQVREQLVDGLLKARPSTARAIVDERQQELF